MNFKNRLIAIATLFVLLIAHGGYAQGFTFSGGSGTLKDPYKIASEKDLRALAAAVSGESGQPNSFTGVYFKQTADITLSDRPFHPIGIRAENPDGTATYFPFSGVYDGDYHMIHNLLCGDYEIPEMSDYQSSAIGMFGVVTGDGARIENLFVISGCMAGYLFVGGIVGQLKDQAIIENCAVGTNVQVLSSIGYSGGICGTISSNSRIKKCINFADVYCRAANSFNAGGIVGSVVSSYVEGCANYGDVFCPRYAGGIVGSYPLKKSPSQDYKYYPIKSCYNAGDISTQMEGAGGIIGGWPYLEKEKGCAVENGYNYGRSYSNEGSFGPIVAVCLSNSPQESRNTYFDLDRYVSKPDANSNSYIHGIGKTHQEMYSDETLRSLNENALYPYTKDKDKINQGYPVLQWWQEFYVKHGNIYQELRKAYPEKYYTLKKQAGHMFEPNKYGDFYFVNRDKQELRMAFKAEGARRGEAVLIQSRPSEDNTTMIVFKMHSFFKQPLTNDYLFNTDDQAIKPADRWLITPEFQVKKEEPVFHWLAASEDPSFLEGYEVYVGGEEDITPDAYSSSTPLFKTAGEAPIQNGTEKEFDNQGNEVDRSYFILQPRQIDLSAYTGKKVRIAFRDNTKNKFSLWLSGMKLGTATTGNQTIQTPDRSVVVDIRPDHKLYVRASEGTHIYLYSVEGYLLTDSIEELSYHASQSQTCILKTLKDGIAMEVRKILL